MEKVRFGIIGVGNIGTAHALSFDKGAIENGILTAVADINPDKLTLIDSKLTHKVKLFNTAEELLDSKLCDCVIISVPHYDHPTLAIKALQKEINVIVEKPAGVYTKQVKEMNEVAKKSSLIFGIMFNQRTNPMYIKMRSMIKAGELGEIKRLNWVITDWYRTDAYYNSSSWRASWIGEGGGVLFNQCPHQIDLIQFLTCLKVKNVVSFCEFGKWHDIEVEDDVTAYFQFENGATGVFVTTTADTPGTNRLEITGTKGTLICDTHLNTLVFEKLDVDEREWCKTSEGGFTQPNCIKELITVEEQKLSQHETIINNVANAILKKEVLYADGLEGIDEVELADAMLLSTWLGNKKITLPIDDELYLRELDKRRATSSLRKTNEKVLDTKNSFGGNKK